MHFQMLYNSHFQKGNTNLSPIFELKFNSTLTILGFWPRFENYPIQLNRKIGEKSKKKKLIHVLDGKNYKDCFIFNYQMHKLAESINDKYF